MTCPSNCGSNCTGSCYGQCIGNCGISCQPGCGGACAVNCGEICNGNCTGDCKDTCSGCTSCTGCSGCGNACSTTCANNCGGNCSSACNSTCKNGAQDTAAAALTLDEYIKQEDIQRIATFVKNEVSRRGKTGTAGTFTVGTTIDAAAVNKIVADLKTAGQSTATTVSANNSALKTWAESLITLAKAAYNTIVPLG